jgi:LysR family glycine cleavage system transcriptional activator
MRRKIPSTLALEMFDSSARHQSFTKAADEMSVTQSAVCRQIAGLEDFLGLKLFRRTKRGVVLTEAGANYSRQVRARLDEVERDAFELMATGGHGGTLELGVVPTFATKWLLPRLTSFLRGHPDVTVNLTPRTRPFLFAETNLDAAIYAGKSNWPGTEGFFLMRESLVAVGSPKLVAPRRTIAAKDVVRYTLLQQTTRPYAWRAWFSSLGMQAENDLAGPRLELFSMLTEAAIQGMGIALIPRFLIEDELRRGLLLVLVKHEFLSDRSYYLIYPEQKSERPVLRTFQAWLEEQAKAYRDPTGLG